MRYPNFTEEDKYMYTFDAASFSELRGKKIKSIEGLEKDSQQVEIFTDDGYVYVLYHEQECCESVLIDDVNGNIEDLLNSTVNIADEKTNEGATDSYMHLTWTFYTLATIKGYVDFRWRGESNGYYSERVNICKKKVKLDVFDHKIDETIRQTAIKHYRKQGNWFYPESEDGKKYVSNFTDGAKWAIEVDFPNTVKNLYEKYKEAFEKIVTNSTRNIVCTFGPKLNSIQDSYPEDGENVIAICKDEPDRAYGAYYYSDLEAWFSTETGDCLDKEFTHWMYVSNLLVK